MNLREGLGFLGEILRDLEGVFLFFDESWYEENMSTYMILWYWLVVSTHLKNISQHGNLPQIGVKIKNIWNHHLVMDDCCVGDCCWFLKDSWSLKQHLYKKANRKIAGDCRHWFPVTAVHMLVTLSSVLSAWRAAGGSVEKKSESSNWCAFLAIVKIYIGIHTQWLV